MELLGHLAKVLEQMHVALKTLEEMVANTYRSRIPRILYDLNGLIPRFPPAPPLSFSGCFLVRWLVVAEAAVAVAATAVVDTNSS